MAFGEGIVIPNQPISLGEGVRQGGNLPFGFGIFGGGIVKARTFFVIRDRGPINEVTNVEEAAYGVGPHYYVASGAGQAKGERITQVLQSVTVRRY